MFITMALIPILKTVAVKMNAMDFPNPRKVHARPVPKIGGIAMALGVLVPVALYVNGDRFVNSVLIGAWIVVITGVIDDFKGLGYKAKFAGQVAAALVVIFYGGLQICSLGSCLPEDTLLPNYLAAPVTLLVIVGVTNAINLSDGLDGLAAGSSLLIFLCISYLAYTGLYLPGNQFIAVLAVAVIGASFGFLRFNTYPATVFMGDAGSQLLGFLAITLSLGLTQANTPLSAFLPLILLGFPVLDTVTVMVERVSKGRSPFVADKNHFHHKLMRIGLYHTEAVVAIYFITTFLVSAAFIFRFQSEWFLLIFYLIFSGLVILGFTATDRTGWKLQRPGLFDFKIKDRLVFLKERQILIKFSFYFMQVAVPLLVIFTFLFPAEIPRYYSWGSVALAWVILLIWIFQKKWLAGSLRPCFYLLAPAMIYLGKTNPAGWMTPKVTTLYNLSFAALVVFMVLTLKFTRRQKGFKATPLDFLIIVIALVVPNLPDPRIQSYNMGLMAVKIIVLFFSFEVLVGELRGQLAQLSVATIVGLLLLAARGLV
jgi:UDP-GlcNAc:undecaprenyl-phosphate GlcNAc-1-phosphate transferase